MMLCVLQKFKKYYKSLRPIDAQIVCVCGQNHVQLVASIVCSIYRTTCTTNYIMYGPFKEDTVIQNLVKKNRFFAITVRPLEQFSFLSISISYIVTEFASGRRHWVHTTLVSSHTRHTA